MSKTAPRPAVQRYSSLQTINAKSGHLHRLMLLGVYNLICQMQGYRQENITRMEQSYQYRYHFAQHITWKREY